MTSRDLTDTTRYKAWLLIFVFAVLPCAALRADIVYLRSGGKVEGTIEDDNAKEVVVKTAFGSQKIAKVDILRIEKGKTTRQIYEEKKAALKPGDAEALYQLALWCQEQKFTKEAKKHLEETIQADPNHEGARKALGFVKVGDQWLTPKEAAAFKERKSDAEMEARGLVKYRNSWVTPEEKENLEKGLVKYGSAWVTPEEKNRFEKGLVEFEGRWVTPAEKEKLEQGLEQYHGKWLPADEVAKIRQQWANAWEAENKHWKVRCNVESGMAEEALSMLEAAWPILKEHYGGEPKPPLQVNFYRTVEEFIEKADVTGPDAKEVQGRIDPPNSRVSLWRHARDRSTVFGTLLEVSARLFGSLVWENRMPEWLDYGSAAYFREKNWFDGKLEVGCPSRRLTTYMESMQEKKSILSLADVLNGDVDALAAAKKMDVWYSQTWALVRLLRQDRTFKASWPSFLRKLRAIYANPSATAKTMQTDVPRIFTETYGALPEFEKKYQEALLKP